MGPGPRTFRQFQYPSAPLHVQQARVDVTRIVLGCEIGDLLIPEPEKVSRPGRSRRGRRALSEQAAERLFQ